MFLEEQKEHSITAKLKYIPVNLKEIHKMRVWYVCRFVVIQFGVALAVQLMSAWFSCHEITWVNVVYVLCIALLWPLIVNVMSAVRL